MMGIAVHLRPPAKRALSPYRARRRGSTGKLAENPRGEVGEGETVPLGPVTRSLDGQSSYQGGVLLPPSYHQGYRYEEDGKTSRDGVQRWASTPSSTTYR